MIRIRIGEVQEITSKRPGATEVLVRCEGQLEKAVNYDEYIGTVRPGDRVVLNTSAVTLGLGTGGYHFVMVNLENLSTTDVETGHIMKMRYTPFQLPVMTVEEEKSPFCETMRNSTALQENTPVVIGTLHSMLGPFTASANYLNPNLKIVYIMTDGGALPLAFSKQVSTLKECGLLHATVTCGHAFGGDYEAINIYSALIAAQAVAEADVIFVAMGPGIVGTGQKYGYSGVEQGEIINAVAILGGTPIAIPRISFADKRTRHRGISHHTLTALGEIALRPAIIPLPILEEMKQKLLDEQLERAGLNKKHHIKVVDGKLVMPALNKWQIRVTTMGRGAKETPEFFLACGAAARVAAENVLRINTKKSPQEKNDA